MLGHDHRDAPLVADAPDEGRERQRLGRVDAGDDLVEQEDARHGRQRARELEPLAAGQGEHPGVLALTAGEADEREHLGSTVAGVARHGAARVDRRDLVASGVYSLTRLFAAKARIDAFKKEVGQILQNLTSYLQAEGRAQAQVQAPPQVQMQLQR